MKKKHRAQIPDFSRKPVTQLPAQDKLKAQPKAPVPTVKPRATSAKSGRRGQ
ncbi:MAG TPA: hypothetical protein VJ803_07575 [Gemmatimonadaceae bacterium]|jgi:hypothetical protein|nr:hypothetical protein [Gemmatimonadaceae bacterium]